MSLIPGYTRADDSVNGGVNLGIRGNRAFYGSSSWCPFSYHESSHCP